MLLAQDCYLSKSWSLQCQALFFSGARVVNTSQQLSFSLSLSLSVSLSVSLSGSGMSCHITPNSYAGEAPFAGNFPAHASMCYSQPLCTTFRVREWMQSKTCVPHFTGLWCQKDWRPAGMHPSMGSRLWELAFKCAGPKP